MDSELQALEDRIRQAATLSMRLRADNVDLRQRIAALERGDALAQVDVLGAQTHRERRRLANAVLQRLKLAIHGDRLKQK